MSSVEEHKPLHNRALDVVPDKDRKHVAFCPIGLSDSEIIEFSHKNRDKKLLFTCFDFTKQLDKLYNTKLLTKVIAVLSRLCSHKFEIKKDMSLIDVLKLVHNEQPMFMSHVLYYIYNNMRSSSEKTNIREVLMYIASRFDETFELNAGNLESLLREPMYSRPIDWS